MKARVREVIVVEGRYDKNALLQAVDATVISTDGFGIFKDEQKKSLLRRLARERGLIVLTDGDGAGFLIRSHLKSVLPSEGVRHAYIPDRAGKEPRKRTPGREGKLGVEGMSPDVLLEALRRAGATFGEDSRDAGFSWLTKADLMQDGLCGTAGSAQKRTALLKQLDLPERLTSNALLDVLGALYTREEYRTLIEKLEEK